MVAKSEITGALGTPAPLGAAPPAEPPPRRAPSNVEAPAAKVDKAESSDRKEVEDLLYMITTW